MKRQQQQRKRGHRELTPRSRLAVAPSSVFEDPLSLGVSYLSLEHNLTQTSGAPDDYFAPEPPGRV